jgi:hypothetical protein
VSAPNILPKIILKGDGLSTAQAYAKVIKKCTDEMNRLSAIGTPKALESARKYQATLEKLSAWGERNHRFLV